MRLNAANRSFFALVATALVPYALLGLFGCGVLSLIAFRLSDEGWAGLTRDGQDLRPAAVFFAVVVAGTAIGARSVHRQVVATGALAAEVAARRLPPTAAIETAAAAAGLIGRVDLIGDPRPYSFTYGLRSPRVAVSTGLVAAAGGDELAAVLAHERYHLRNADTLKCVVARAVPAAFFFLPALGHLRDRYLSGRELAADRAAVAVTGDRALVGALSRVLDGPGWTDLDGAAALGGGVLEARLEQLETGTEPSPPRIAGRTLAVTVTALAALVALFGLTIAGAGGLDVLAMDGSMPDNGGGVGLNLLTGAACTAAMAVAVILAVTGGGSHRRMG